MTVVIDKTGKALGGEPALIIGAVISVLNAVLAIITGQATGLDGSTAVFTTIYVALAPLVGSWFIRSKVTPISTNTQGDAR